MSGPVMPKMHGYLMHRLLDVPERLRRILVPEIEDYAKACFEAGSHRSTEEPAVRPRLTSAPRQHRGPLDYRIDHLFEEAEVASPPASPSVAEEPGPT